MVACIVGILLGIVITLIVVMVISVMIKSGQLSDKEWELEIRRLMESGEYNDR